MSEVMQYYIGWDVGAWNCDKNSKSRDALVIIDANSKLVGTPWRGSLRVHINDSKTAVDFVSKLFALCKTGLETNSSFITIAIDAPLGFSKGLIELINGNIYPDNIVEHCNNPYLFRATEQLLFKKELKPLSSIKDMIGSQTTKAMHVVRKFTPEIESCGVFTDEAKKITIIETYPAACRNLESKVKLPANSNTDIIDALKCAEIAKLFGTNKNALQMPDDKIPISEGWIWILKIKSEMMQELLTGRTKLI